MGQVAHYELDFLALRSIVWSVVAWVSWRKSAPRFPLSFVSQLNRSMAVASASDLSGVYSVVLVENLQAHSLRLTRADLLACIRNKHTRTVTMRVGGYEVKRWIRPSAAAKFVEGMVTGNGIVFVVVGDDTPKKVDHATR